MPLHRWLIALGINEIGETTARDISEFHKTFEDIKNSKWLDGIIRLSELYSERIILNPNGNENKYKSLNEKKVLKDLFEKNFNDCSELLKKLSELHQ
jgi:NAD-dependent DNA ligase